ncbi:hypothetical protein ACGF8B_12155 [Streptomyces sp. NPDC047917]|uniref:hypothetical protein n=1 Tax=Streptomyces sp. NPDC047917 TaxID=3365491 RepID=UPI003716210B
MPTCFAIGPSGSTRVAADGTVHDMDQRSTVFYEEVVRPVCERFGLTLVRADEVAGADALSERSLRHLIDDDIVIADLTGGSPEVVYGLGIRHTTGRRTVHLCEAGAAPFVSGAFPTIEYPALPLGSAEARQALATTLTQGLFGAVPLLPPARVPLPGPLPGATSTAGAEPAGGPVPFTAQDEDPGFWDRVADAEAAMEAIVDDMAEVDAALLDLAAMGELLNEEMLRANLPGTPTSARLAALNRFAKAIEGPSDDLEAASGRFVERMSIAADAMSAFLQWAGDTPRHEWTDEVDGLLDQVIKTAQEVREAAGSVREVEPLIQMLGMASRQLRRPSRKIGASFRAMLTSLAMFDEWERTALALKRG